MIHSLLTFLQSLPKGKVTTYNALGNKFGLHPRAVASILKTNPLPGKYPCYKVVHSDGRLGGYAGGKEKKRELLEAEGVRITQDLVQEEHIDRFGLK